MKRGFWSLLLAVGLLSAVTTVLADPIGPDCGSCFGTIITLEYDSTPVVTSATTDTWEITLTIDTSGYSNLPDPDTLKTVGFKVANSVVDVDRISEPAGWSGTPLINTGVNTNGCAGGGNGFICDDATTGISVPDGILSWTYHVEVAKNALFTDPFEASVKANYDGPSSGVTSEAITLQVVRTPEPSVTLLLGLSLTGIAALGHLRRKRFTGEERRG